LVHCRHLELRVQPWPLSALLAGVDD
jgi:hypothetical protein